MPVRPVRRRIARFLAEPASLRNAMAVIVSAMCVSVGAGGVLVWIVDRQDFPNVWLGMWWSLQTVTTVGYGDVTPSTWIGRVVGAAIMVESIAFVSILTALIASSFVERAQRERASTSPLQTRLDEIATRLASIEATLRAMDADPPHTEPKTRGDLP